MTIFWLILTGKVTFRVLSCRFGLLCVYSCEILTTVFGTLALFLLHV